MAVPPGVLGCCPCDVPFRYASELRPCGCQVARPSSRIVTLLPHAPCPMPSHIRNPQSHLCNLKSKNPGARIKNPEKTEENFCLELLTTGYSIFSLCPMPFCISAIRNPKSQISHPTSPSVYSPFALDKTSSMCLLVTPLWSYLRPLRAFPIAKADIQQPSSEWDRTSGL